MDDWSILLAAFCGGFLGSCFFVILLGGDK